MKEMPCGGVFPTSLVVNFICTHLRITPPDARSTIVGQLPRVAKKKPSARLDS
jgi:hypothetical protein